jgi:hypothetical protein
MDIKATLLEPKTWVTVASVALILILGLGPLMTGMEGGTDHADSEHSELMETLSEENKEAFVDVVNQELFVFGLWNVTMCLMFLAMVYLTDGETQAKLSMVAACSMLFVSGVGGYSVNGDAYFSEWVTLCALLSAPILITGYMKLNEDGS